MGPTVDTMLGRGHEAADAGRWNEARRLFRKAAVETTPLLRDRARATDARRWCSIAGMRLGDWTAAAADARISLRNAKGLADVCREAKSLNVAGAVEFERGDWRAALVHFSKARLLARSAGDRPLEARIDNNEGALWAARGLPSRARRLYASALAGFRANQETAAAARVMNNLGLSLLEEGAPTEAREWFDQATKAARLIGDNDLLLTVLINTARAAAEGGDLARARVSAAEARTLAERMEGDPALADLACTLAAIARIERRWPQAEEWIALALEAAKEGKNPFAAADAWEQRARVRLGKGRIDEAGRAIEKSRAAYQSLGADAAVARLDQLTSALPTNQP
ncbi:MAG: tetratricopeptide repeat protein [Gemmatimonadota bacterium]